MNYSQVVNRDRQSCHPYFNEKYFSFRSGMSLADIEKSVIIETLKEQSFNRTHTARVLGIGIRTLQRKIKLYRDTDLNVVVDYPIR